MREQHVIYRHRSAGCPRWQVRILTADIPADTAADTAGNMEGQGPVWVPAATLAGARAAALSGLGAHRVVEHVEHELDGGLYLRRALDGEIAHRGEVARLLGGCLTDRRIRGWLARTILDPGAAPVVVTCVPGDPVTWLVGQCDTTPLVVATAVGNSRAWWSLLAGPTAVAPVQGHASLAELGLLDPDATLEDWMVRVPPGWVLTAPAGTTAGGAVPLRRAA